MAKYWKYNTKVRLHEWFDMNFRKKHYIESMNDEW